MRKSRYITVLPHEKNDNIEYTGVRIFVPSTPMLISFFCLCNSGPKAACNYYLKEGMHYFCLCHGHKTAYNIWCRLSREKQIKNLTCTRQGERYFIINEQGTGRPYECSPPSLKALSKSAIFQYNLESLTQNSEEFPVDLFDTKVRTKNCIATECHMTRGVDCTDTCPDKNEVCTLLKWKIYPNHAYETWQKLPETLKKEMENWVDNPI
jgi:hypothetical protein